MHSTTKQLPVNPNDKIDYTGVKLREIYFAGGCFWGVEAYMARVFGVASAVSGYANGRTENPKYEDLIYRFSGHAETVKVLYDPDRVSLNTLILYYFKIIDPTSLNRQGNDVGEQYRTGIYYTDAVDLNTIQRRIDVLQQSCQAPVLIEVKSLEHFYLAEDYHQQYLEKNPTGYCHINLFDVEEVLIDPDEYHLPTDQQLKEKLSDTAYQVIRHSATERPFTGTYSAESRAGIYVDIATGEPLFLSNDKFDAGCGWPSFSKPIAKEVINYLNDDSHNMSRVEVKSRTGDSHLGHVFNDGPDEFGGLRYCINSAALRFIAKADMAAEGYGHLIHLVD